MSTTPQCKLITDFRQPYDHWFARSDQHCDLVFERFIKSGPSRNQMFKMMVDAGLNCPLYGSVETLSRKLDSKALIVVYVDEMAHCGEGKKRLKLNEALVSHPRYLCSEYISGSATSYRYLAIGKREFWLKYESSNDWRSNVGDVTITIINEMLPNIDRSLFNYPLVAIDFVESGDGKLFAIDLNIAPGITGTGIDDSITNREVATEIIEYLSSDKNQV